jgi:lysophospholipase L1-like esterase
MNNLLGEIILRLAPCRRFGLSVVLVLLCMLAASLPLSARKADLCIGSGQEQAVQSAIRPFRLGAVVADEFVLENLSIEARQIVVTLGRSGAEARLLLLPPGRAGLRQLTNFSMQSDGDPSAAHAMEQLVRRISQAAYNPWSACARPVEPSLELTEALARRDSAPGWLGWVLLAMCILMLYGLAFSMNRRGRKLGSALALVASSVLFTLLVVESIWRTTPLRPGVSFKLRDGCYDSNPRGTFTPVPVAGHPEWTFYCVGGSARTRVECERPTAHPPPGALRIVALGDSFSEALGVRYEESWPRILEQSLNAAPQAPPVSVVNCARSGANSAEILERYRQFVPQHRPKIVVYAWVLNDPLVPRGADGLPVAEISFQPETREELTARLAAHPVLNLLMEQTALGRYFVYRWVTRQVAQNTEQAYRALYAEPLTPEFEAALERTEELARDVTANGGRLLVAIWPLLVSLNDYPFADAHRLITRELARRGIETLDLLPAINAQPTESLWVHPSDYHPNEIAQNLAAKAILAKLEELDWVVAKPE